MRALLVLYMTASLQEGGLGITVAMAEQSRFIYRRSIFYGITRKLLA